MDLAIQDIKLKGMSGIEMLALPKESNPGMRAIMLTGYSTMETVRAAMGLGVDEYGVKPVDRAGLEEKMEKVLALDKGR